MRFEHEGVLVTHHGLHRAFLRGVRFLDEEGVFVVQLGHFRGQIDVEDTPFWVVAYDPDTGHVDLTDQSAEPLDPATVTADPDGAFRCTVKRRFPARFTHAAQSHLLAAVDIIDDTPAVRAGTRWLPLSSLSVPA